MAANRLSRRKKKKRANTLDPTSESFRDSARFALSVSPAPPDDSKKLKSKAKTPRMAKSKSPSSSKSKNTANNNNSVPKLGKKKKKTKRERGGARRRATSDAQSVGLQYNKSNKMNKSPSPSPLRLDYRNNASFSTPNKSKQSKKSKKYQSQTPGTDYVGTVIMMDSDDPFGIKKKIKNNKSSKSNKSLKAKKSSMTPKVSLSTTIESSVFSSDDELNGAEYEGSKIRSKSARFSAKKKVNNNDDEKVNNNVPSLGSAQSLSSNISKKQQQKRTSMKLTNSMTINQGSKNLGSSINKIKKEISGGFEQFHKAMNEQQNKLIDDLESIYDDKKEELIDIEHKLFENGQKSKNVKAKEYEFDPNVNLRLNKPKILQQIKKYGYIEGVDTNNDKNEAFNKISSISMHLNGGSVIIHNEDLKEEEMDDDFDDFDDLDDGELSTAAKQKLVLGEIQQKTMSKLDTVILMEKEAKKKAKQAAILQNEVDEALKFIDGRTKIINEKLLAAKPELDLAKAAVNGIDPKDINEIKTLKAPPVVIENVITATCMILGHKIKEWHDVKRLLSYKFKPELINFDTYTLTKATRQKVFKKYAGKEDFNYDRVYEGSKCCGNLVLWVLSQIKYSRVLDVIIPLEKELKKLKKEIKKKQKLAKQLLKIVNELKENIKLYTNQCNQMIDHIIKSTDYELKQFSDKLQPLNEKFNAILNNKVLD